jgi:transposase
MNGNNFQKWFCENHLENISIKSVIVMDNASYHSCKSETCPNSSTRKADIQAWLTKHNIPFDKKLVRPELLALVKANKPEPQYIIDDIAKEKGHIILRLQPYHPDLNPIELVWDNLRR